MPYIPHTRIDVEAMLKTIGVATIDDLFDEIPQSLQQYDFDAIPLGCGEMAMTRKMQERLAQDNIRLNFMGAGAYEHHIPATVWELASRGEFMTAYTPYQAEASQGALQLIYEYQTMMSSLTGMDVSNASLYDGATAVAEGILMAIRCNRAIKNKKVLIAGVLHPYYVQTIETIVGPQGITVETVPFDSKAGCVHQEALQQLSGEYAAVVIPQPNFFGALDDVDTLTRWAKAKEALVIAVVNPTSLVLLKDPGAWGEEGADIACGEGQPLGIPLANGGPYFGFLTCKTALVRQMPGRIVGKTEDAMGREGYTLTLQAREQHIRRSKATSNICTNQGLAVTAATIYLSLMGLTGLQRVANACHNRMNYCLSLLTAIPGVSATFTAPYFHEAVVTLPVPAKGVLRQLAAEGIQGGVALKDFFLEMENQVLVCVTETKTEADCELLAKKVAQYV